MHKAPEVALGQATLSAADEGDLLREAAVAARAYIAGLAIGPARPPRAESAVAELAGPLPDDGVGAAATVAELAGVGKEAAIRSAGPRFYLPSRDDPRPTLGFLTPESSRRARALPVWATLRAYGRAGYRRLVERHLELAKGLARLVGGAPDFELLADCQLNIVCFRYRPPGTPEDALDGLNRALGAAVIEDGRVYLGTTVYDGKVAFRPAIVNWRTTAADVESIIDVLRELGRSLSADATG